MKLTAKQLETITDAVDSNTYGQVRSYSGRGMFGESCLGIVTSDTARCFMALAVTLVDNGEQEILALLTASPSREDSLGKDAIIYFPRLIVEDDESDEEDEDDEA